MATLTHFGTCGRFWLIKAPRGVWAKLAWDRCSRSLNSKFGFENDNTLDKMVERLLIYHFSKLGLRMTPCPMSQGVNYKWAFRRRQMLIFVSFRSGCEFHWSEMVIHFLSEWAFRRDRTDIFLKWRSNLQLLTGSPCLRHTYPTGRWWG